MPDPVNFIWRIEISSIFGGRNKYLVCPEKFATKEECDAAINSTTEYAVLGVPCPAIYTTTGERVLGF